jgi:hypothetical protein
VKRAHGCTGHTRHEGDLALAPGHDAAVSASATEIEFHRREPRCFESKGQHGCGVLLFGGARQKRIDPKLAEGRKRLGDLLARSPSARTKVGFALPFEGEFKGRCPQAQHRRSEQRRGHKRPLAIPIERSQQRECQIFGDHIRFVADAGVGRPLRARGFAMQHNRVRDGAHLHRDLGARRPEGVRLRWPQGAGALQLQSERIDLGRVRRHSPG